MNIKDNKGITMVALTIIIVIMLILASITIGGSLSGVKETEHISDSDELNMVQHAILERYTKAQLTKESLPGTKLNSSEISEIEQIISELNTQYGTTISLKGSDYYLLNEQDLQNLGIKNEEDIFVVNYKTGEVFNKTKRVTNSGEVLYTYAKDTE